MDEINTTEECGAKNEVMGRPAPPADKKPVLLEIALEKLRPSKFWIRSDWQKDLNSLAESINTDGLLQFPEVRENGDGTYTIISGHRRYFACKESGRQTILCRVLDVTEQQAAIEHRKQISQPANPNPPLAPALDPGTPQPKPSRWDRLRFLVRQGVKAATSRIGISRRGRTRQQNMADGSGAWDRFDSTPVSQ